MGTTTTIFGPDFLKDLIPQMIQIFSDATAKAYHMIWNIFMTFLTQNLVLIIVVLVAILVLSFLEYLMTGMWANLGSVLYSYTYYGILFLIGLIFGPEVFAKDWIVLILFIVYVVSFIWVRIVLSHTGIRKH